LDFFDRGDPPPILLFDGCDCCLFENNDTNLFTTPPDLRMTDCGDDAAEEDGADCIGFSVAVGGGGGDGNVFFFDALLDGDE